jgi:hypothetical protein
VKSLALLSGNTDRNGREFLRKSAKLPIFFSAADDDDGAVDLMQWLYGISPIREASSSTMRPAGTDGDVRGDTRTSRE